MEKDKLSKYKTLKYMWNNADIWICKSPGGAYRKQSIEWYHFFVQIEKPQHRCRTTVHPAYNGSKNIFENLLSVGLLMRTNLFIPSRFWITHTKFDSCSQRYVATCGKNLYRCTSTVSALNYCSRIFQILQLSIRSGAHNLFRRFFWTFRNF